MQQLLEYWNDVEIVKYDFLDDSILNSNFYIHSASFHMTSRAIGSSIHTSSRGGRHGYGGGGRGGGGGGGGH